MVGNVGFCVDIAHIWPYIIRTENIVDSEIHAPMAVGKPRTCCISPIAVVQPLCYLIVGIGVWRVIEVAAEHYTHVTMLFDVSSYSLCLWSPLAC